MVTFPIKRYKKSSICLYNKNDKEVRINRFVSEKVIKKGNYEIIDRTTKLEMTSNGKKVKKVVYDKMTHDPNCNPEIIDNYPQTTREDVQHILIMGVEAWNQIKKNNN